MREQEKMKLGKEKTEKKTNVIVLKKERKKENKEWMKMK